MHAQNQYELIQFLQEKYGEVFMTENSCPEVSYSHETPREDEFDVIRDLRDKHGYPDLKPRLSRLVTKPRDSMDAMFVPAARAVSREYVGRIATVAKETDTRFFAFVSHQADAGAMADMLDKMSVPEWWVVEVPDEGHDLPFMKFKSPDAVPDHTRKKPPSNLSHKRNLGSLVGKVMGMDRVIFSDDDVRYRPDALRAVSLMLPGHKIAGMECGYLNATEGFPDKDVVHHAEAYISFMHGSPSIIGSDPAAGHISGNSIAANPQISGLVFPPEIYNEDVIAFYDMYAEVSAALAVDAHYLQLPYDPYSDPKRAESEAFGELIHAGLFLPLWGNQPADLTDKGHWDSTIARQIDEIETLLRALDAPQKRKYFNYTTEPPLRDPAEEAKIKLSLQAALRMNETFKGAMGVDYLRVWNEDKETFRNCVPDLPDRQSIPDALGWLGLNFRSNAAE